MNPEIRITSTLRYFRQTGRLTGFHFEKPLLPTRVIAFIRAKNAITQFVQVNNGKYLISKVYVHL